MPLETLLQHSNHFFLEHNLIDGLGAAGARDEQEDMDRQTISQPRASVKQQSEIRVLVWASCR